MNAISCTTANFVARETGWAMHGWGHGDRATNEGFRPLATFADRFDELLAAVRALGFDAIDLWGAHLSPEWGTDAHVSAARDALAARGITVTTYATWVHRPNVVRACELALALGTNVIGAGFSGDARELAPVLRDHGVTLAVENHPERTPAELVAKIDAGGGTMAATVDTGWWATQGCDPVRALEELAGHVIHVHLKDVLHEGEPHETCPWGHGVVDVEGCVRALQRLGYEGALTVEHEPEDHDPGDELRAMRERLKRRLR